MFLLPVIVHLALRRVDGELSRRVFIAGMALVLVVQALLSTEILLDACLIGFAALIVGYYAAERSLRPQLNKVALEILIAGLVAIVVLLPYLLWALAVPPLGRGGDTYGMNALNLVIPTPTTWLGGNLFRSVSAWFEGGQYSETDGYIGLPLLLAFCWFAIATWRTRRATRVLVIMFAVSVVLALGSPLHVGPDRLIGLPWALLQRLPLILALGPSRIAVFFELILAICVAIWLADRPGHSPMRWLIALLGVAALFPNLALGSAAWASRADNPRFFTTSDYKHYLTPGEGLLAIPFGDLGNSMLWQAETDFYFTMPGGYISGIVPKADQTNAAITAFYAGSSTQARLPATIAPTIRTFLRNHHTHQIAIEPAYQQTWARVLNRIARPPQRVGGILLYTLH